MVGVFESTVDMKVLGFFLANPDTEYYTNQIAKRLKIGRSSASRSLNSLQEQGFLTKTKPGMEKYYKLAPSKPMNKHLGIAYFLYRLEQLKLVEKLLEIDEHIISIAIYGSIAAGNYDGRSDLDVLIISRADKGRFSPIIGLLESSLGREALPTVLSPAEWITLAKKKDPFYTEVVKNHVLLYGVELVMA